MGPSPRHSWHRLATCLIWACLGSLSLALAWHTTGDLDLLLHDRAGRDLLAGEGFPRTNTYSFTAPEHPWVNHEWAFQVLVAVVGGLGPGEALAGRFAGWQALRLMLVGALVAVLMADLFRGRSRDPATLALAGPLLLLALGLLWTRLVLRPELLSAILLILVLQRIEAAVRRGQRAHLLRELMDPRQPGGQALLLTALWHQVHGFAALAAPLWLLAGLLLRAPVQGRWRIAAGGAALAVAAALATPNGLSGLLYPLRALGQFAEPGRDLQRTISELVPLLETRGSLALTLQLYKLSLVWGAVWIVLSWRRVSWLRAALWLLAAVAAWQGQRNLGLYAVTLVLLHAGFTDTARHGPGTLLLGRLRLDRWRPRAAAGAALVLPLATLAVAGWWLTALVDDTFYLREGVARRWGAGPTPATYPVAAAAAVRTGLPLRVGNTIDAASTVINLHAGLVAIDGRTEAYPARAWQQYATLREGGAGALALLRQWRAGAVVVAHRNSAAAPLVNALLADGDWDLVHADPAGVAFRPATGPATAAAAAILHRAAMSLQQELEDAPDRQDARLADRAASLASLLQLAGRTDSARTLLTLGLARRSDHPVLLHNLGNILLAEGDLQGALRRFRAAAELNRGAAPPLVNAGNCLFQLGKLREAAAAYAGATGRDPRNFEAWANLAEARRRLGDRDGAAAAYARALELRPGDRRLRARSLGL